MRAHSTTPREALGIYFSVRGVIDGLLAFCLKPIQTVIYSYYCGLADLNAMTRHLRNGTIIAIAIAIFSGIVLPSQLANFAVVTIWGDAFLPGAALLSGLAMYFFFVIWFENVKVFAMASNLHARAVPARLLQLVFLLMGGTLLVRSLGLSGAGLSTGIGSAIACISASLYVLFVPSTTVRFA